MMYGARLDGDLNFANPPAPDEIEVSVFGPGIGESIVVHVGNSKWICVDCAKYDNKAWPIYYLSKLGVPIEGSVSLIVATHWHSDHVDGLSEVVAASQLSPFVCSQALRVDEFKQVIGRYISADRDRIRAPLGEIQRIFGIYLDRRKQDAQYPAPTFASSGQLLMQSGTGTERVQLWSLSPSPEDILKSMREFASLFVPISEYASGIAPLKHNSASVVILLIVGIQAILLGSDLEAPSYPQAGWNAIVGSTVRPEALSTMFKIPHHGSAGAFSQAAWDLLVDRNAIAVVTPFVQSGLPKQTELQRLKAQGRNLYATALPEQVRMTRAAEIDKMVKRVAKNLVTTRVPRKFGLVRLRSKIGAKAWSVELFGSAVKI